VLDIVIQQAWMIWKLYLLGRKNNEHGKEVRLRKRRRERHVSFLLNNDLILETTASVPIHNSTIMIFKLDTTATALAVKQRNNYS